eukprot:gene14344-biopygen12161
MVGILTQKCAGGPETAAGWRKSRQAGTKNHQKSQAGPKRHKDSQLDADFAKNGGRLTQKRAGWPKTAQGFPARRRLRQKGRQVDPKARRRAQNGTEIPSSPPTLRKTAAG